MRFVYVVNGFQFHYDLAFDYHIGPKSLIKPDTSKFYWN